jgi:phosphoglycolate phosphatase
MKNGIIFDMDGTLWDSAAGVAESWNLAIRELGVPDIVFTTESIKNVMGRSMNEIADVFFPQFSLQERRELMKTCCYRENAYLRERGGMLYPQVEETLRALSGRYHLYIVSNCQNGYIEAFLDHYDFWDYFEDFECFGNNELEKGENIRLVAERNALDNAVYVGDIQADYEASRRANVAFIHAAYGFGTIDADVPRIESFKELKTLDMPFDRR